MQVKNVLLFIILVVVSLGLIHCDYSRVSVKMTFNNDVIHECDDAYITDLSPKDGGIRFNCQDSDIYVIYDTDDDIKGTIERLWLQKRGYSSDTDYQTFQVAYFANHDPNIDCPSARQLNRKTGEAPIPRTLFGDLQKGSYPIMLAVPCGELLLEITEPKIK